MNIQLQTAFCLAPWPLLIQILLSKIATAVAAAFDTTSARAVIAAATSAAVPYVINCVAIVKGITLKINEKEKFCLQYFLSC